MKYFSKIASVLTSAAMIGSTVGLAAAANFPAPFVQNGVADVAVVYGTNNAANTDLAAVADIQAQLAQELASQATTTDTVSVSGGDAVKLSKSTDEFNLGNAMNRGTWLSIDDDDLAELLMDGTYRNDENTEYDYEQDIKLGALTLTHFADSDYKDKEPTIGFRITDNTFVMNYTLDFSTDAESDVSGGDLVDIETTDLVILGKTYYVSDADNSTLKLTLLDSATSGVVEEGETVTIAGFDVSIHSLSTTEARLNINGQITNDLDEGESFKLDDGTYVGIKDIFQRDVAGVVGNVEFSLGTGKLEIFGEDGTDIELNDDSISGVRGYVVRGTPSGGKESIDSITIEWIADDEEFVTPDQELVMPGFGAVKLFMNEFTTPAEEEVIVDYDGDDAIELRVPIKDGLASFNILGANATGEFVRIGGDTSDEILRTSSNASLRFNESSDEWFVATYNTSSDYESYLLSLKVDTVDNKNRTTFTNKVTGSTFCKDKTAGDTCDIGDVSLTIDTVFKIGSVEYVELTAGTDVSFNTIFSNEGLAIDLPFEASNTSTERGAINFANEGAPAGHNEDSFFLFFTEENKDDDVAAGNSFNVTLNDDSDGDVHVTDFDTASTKVDVLDADDDEEAYVISDIATKVVRRVVSDKGKAIITYSGGESFADVFLGSIETQTVGVGVVELGSVMVADSEVSSVSGKNLIVVGGSCVNSVAAQLVGGSLCGADWEAATGVGAGQYLIETYISPLSSNKIATLVAGYNALDTTNAAKALTTGIVSTDVGAKTTGP